MSGNGLSDAVSPLPQITAFPAVNTFSLIGITMPGKWTLVSASRKFGWQIQKGYGISGAQVFPTGDELVVAKFKGELWANVDIAVFKEIRKQLFVKPCIAAGGGIVTSAMAISHPELKAMSCSQVVVLEVGALIQEANGLWVQTIDFLEFRPPIKAPKKPTVIIPDVVKPPPVAKEDYEIENERLTSEILTRPLGG